MSSTLNFFIQAHSGWRYIVFFLLVIAIIQSIAGLAAKKGYSGLNHKLNMFAMISADIQLLLGIVLLFISDKVKFDKAAIKGSDTVRYFTVEHWVMMLLAIALIHVGYSRSKKAATPAAKHKSIAIFYFLALFVIIGAIIAGKLPLFGSIQ